MFGCGTVLVLPKSSPLHLDGPMLTQHPEHVQRLMDHDQETTNNCIQHYKSALRAIYDDVPLIAQISKSLTGPATAATINSNYLCLQCPIIMKEADMPTHGKQKSHRFCRCQDPVARQGSVLTALFSRRIQDWLSLLSNV